MVRFDDLPADVIHATKLRVLDVVGLALGGTATRFGGSLRAAAGLMGAAGAGRLLGTGERVGILTAAFVNGALSQALEFDDTHNESIVHMSSPSVAAALALAEETHPSGRRLLTAIALGNEISCRVGCVAPGLFHRRGFHPTGLFAPFGVAYLAGRLLDLDAGQMTNAAGIVGSFAAGLLQCWVDGTQAKFLHPGWAAQSGLSAAFLGRTSTTGPRDVFEGRFGLFAAHLQDPSQACDFDRIARGLGQVWESRRASFKPFPAAHVIHPYIDAALRLRERHRIAPQAIARVLCPVAPYIIPIVCEPAEEKRRPKSDSHGRVSLQYTLAETLVRGRLDRAAYAEASLTDAEILALADRVDYRPDPTFPGPERYKGSVTLVLADGTRYEETEEANRGCADNPLSEDEILAKFRDNAGVVLDARAIDRLAATILALDGLADAAEIVELSIAR